VPGLFISEPRLPLARADASIQMDRAAAGRGKDRFHSVPNFPCARAPTCERWTGKPAVSQRLVFPLHHFLPVRAPQGNKWDAVERLLTKRRHDLDAFALAALHLSVADWASFEESNS
jgi:hypothetical protein